MASRAHSPNTSTSIPHSFLAALTATDVLTQEDHAEAQSQANQIQLEMMNRLTGLPDSYFIQLARDDSNAPLIRAGEVVVADQGGAQQGGLLPTDGGLFIIEYRSMSDYPDQRHPRVSRDIVQTFRDHKGRWCAGALRKGLVGNTLYCTSGPYRDQECLADKLIGRVVGILSSSMSGRA